MCRVCSADRHRPRRKRGILAKSYIRPQRGYVFWAFAASVLILILTITISNHGIVRIIGSIVLVALLLIGLTQRLRSGDGSGERGKPSSPAAVVTAVPLEAIEVDELRLTGGGAPFDLRGTIRNSSTTTRLQSLTLRIIRLDCFEGAVDPSGCAVIWQDQHWIRVDLAPRSEQKFATSFYAHTTVPRVRGSLKDEFKLVAATGRPEEP